MKTLITIFLMGILTTAYTQTMRISYFRAAETKNTINIYWKTFVEDGTDTFKIYRSINSDECDYAEENWELLKVLPNDNIKTGQYYNADIPLQGGKRYYRVVWGQYNYKMYTTLTVKEMNQVANVFCNNNVIYITDRTYNDSFNVYDINNRIVMENIENGQALDKLPKGLYVVRNEFSGKAIKIVNQ